MDDVLQQVPCPRCGGTDSAGCAGCNGKGWVYDGAGIAGRFVREEPGPIGGTSRVDDGLVFAIQRERAVQQITGQSDLDRIEESLREAGG
jgi:hypothetical protein